MSRADVGESTLAEIAQACNMPVNKIEDVYECSPSQASMIDDPSPDIYQMVLSLGQKVSIDRFIQAIQTLAASVPILRTSIVYTRMGTLQVVGQEPPAPERPCGDVDGYLRTSIERSNWLGVPLFRIATIERNFVATVHHAIMDHWSWITLFNVDLPAAYYGYPPLARPPFKDFVAYCGNIDECEAKSLWASRFSSASPSLFPEASVTAGTEASTIMKTGNVRTIILTRADEAIKSQMASYIEAAWSIVSSIYTGSDCVAYGVLLSGRSSSSKIFRNTLGPTISEVPMQVSLQRSMTVGQLLKGRAMSLKQLQTHPAVHWGKEKVRAAVPASHGAMKYRTVINILPELPGPSSNGDGEGEGVTMDRMITIAATYPLHVIFKITPQGLCIDPTFDPKAISEDYLNQALDQFEHTLRILIESSPGTKLNTLKIFSARDSLTLSSWCTKHPTSFTCLQGTLHAQAQSIPDASAVETRNGIVTYRDLDDLSERLARHLVKMGVSRQTAVALSLPSSTSGVIAILGILKAGGTCVPISHDWPRELRSAVLAKTDAKIVLVHPADQEDFREVKPDVLTVSMKMLASMPGGPTKGKFGYEPFPTDVAYIFAAGQNSRGPGITSYKHCDLHTSSSCQIRLLNWQSGVRVLHHMPYTSSKSLLEVLGTLLIGGCLCIPSEELSRDNLGPQLRAVRPETAILSRSDLRVLQPSDVSSLRSISCFDRHVDAETMAKWSNSGQFYRGWCPWETSTLAIISPATSESPLRGPFGGFSTAFLWIVNLHNLHDLAPIGSIGEILVEYADETRFRGNDLQTHFSACAGPRWAASFGRGASKFYRTGYLGRYDCDGRVFVAGEKSNRVTIKGHTTQLEEIEETLLACDELRDIALAARIAGGRTQLVAIVCLADPCLPSRVALQRIPDEYDSNLANRLAAAEVFARYTLPLDLVPETWIAVERLATNGQDLDRNAIRHWLSQLRI